VKNNSRYFQIFLAHDTITNTKCNDKITVLVIQPNSTHHMCWKMRPNPTQRMDGPNPCPSLLYPRRSPHAFPYPCLLYRSATYITDLSYSKPRNAARRAVRSTRGRRRS